MPENQISAVIEIARHIRDESAETLDFSFDKKAGRAEALEVADGESCECSPTPSGQSCC